MIILDIRKFELIHDQKDYTLVIYLDPQLAEFANELGNLPNKKRTLQAQIQNLIKEKFPNVHIPTAKVMAGSLLVATIYLGTSVNFAGAQTSTTSVVSANQYDTYKVQSGDSLSLIAKRFNVPVNSIKTVNGLTSDTIFIGQVLNLPYFTYTVVSGDSLSVIAKRFNTTIESIRSFNQLTSDMIFIGQKIKIPNSSIPTNTVTPTPAPVPAAPVENNESTGTYTVVAGDSLFLIANKLNTTVATIKTLNNLSTDMIFVGQVLKVPQSLPVETTAPPVTETAPVQPTEPPLEATTTYTVIAGDSLSLIAKRFNTTVLAIKTVNQLSSDMIFIGQKLSIPISETVLSAPVIDNKKQITLENVKQYTIFGVAEPGAKVQITVSDGKNSDITAEATTNEFGEFQTNVDLRSLNDGELTLFARANLAGRQSVVSQTSVTKETSLAAPVIESNKMINTQTAENYLIFGSARPGSTVNITVSDGVNPAVVATAIANGNGEFHLNVNVSSLNDAVLNITAAQTSASGITSQVGQATIEKDTSAPTAPVFNNSHFINQSNQSSFMLTGTAEANTQVNIKAANVNGQIMEATGTANEQGEYRIPVDLSGLNDGDITFTLSQTDRAGNVSSSTSKTLVKDTIAPSTINAEPLPSIYSENMEAFAISGTAEPAVKLDVLMTDGVTNLSKSITTDGSGNFTIPFDVSTLLDGDITVSFTATDLAGNTGQPTRLTIIKDSTAPIAPAVAYEPYVNSLNKTNFLITGTSVEDDGNVTMLISDGTTEITKSVKVVNGVFQADFDVSSLDDGPLTFQYAQTDKAGNKGSAETKAVEKDTVIENPIVSKNGISYDNQKPVLTMIGTAEPNATITVSIQNPNGDELLKESATADSKGFYSLKVVLDQIDSTTITASVSQTDLAGNTSENTAVHLYSHTVLAGDTLDMIAKRYNTTVEALKALNQLTSDVIQPNQVLRLPVTASEVINLGYMYFGNTNEYINMVNNTASSVNTISPSYFDINSDGTLKLTYQVDPDFIATMHQQGIRVVPFLSNHWNREIGRAMLQNKELAAQQIADAVERYNLDGVNVDIENVTDADRDNYTEFVRLLRQKIPGHKEVSVAVAANPNGWTKGWHGSYDYEALAKYADYLMIMSYDESFPGGEAGSVASLPWVEKSIQYAIDQNVAHDKIVLGIAHFGRYWIEGASYGGFGISNSQVEDLIKKYNGAVVLDEISKTPKATITIKPGDPVSTVGGTPLAPGTYTIWYENEESIRHKLALVGQYNIRGVGNWSIGQENKDVWNSYVTTLPTTVPITSLPSTGETEVPATVPPQEPVAESYSTYKVVSGDSLWAIASRNNTTISKIKEINNMSSDMIYVGQVLKIPSSNQTVTAPAPVTDPVPVPVVSTITYTVVSGDSLSVIAKRYNTTVTAIKEENKLTSDTIYIGQKLNITTTTH